MQKEELLIVPGYRQNVYVNGKIDGRFRGYVKRWQVGLPMKREPQYVAIYVKGTKSVRVIAEVDVKRSNLSAGLLVTHNPIKVSIPIRFGKNLLHGIKYTTFRKLFTHKSTDYL